MLDVTSEVPSAARITLREISLVAALCSSTADAIDDAISEIWGNRAADLLDAGDRLMCRGLDVGDLLADLAGGLRGLIGQGLHFGRNHGEAAAGITGAGCFDGGVERQQIGSGRRWC